MHIESFREHCLSKKGAEETTPFGPDALVYKVMGKMFALTTFTEPDQCNLKCDPDRSVQLRASYLAVEPGFHMNKKHWNTVTYNFDADDAMIFELIDHSYELVVKSLTKKDQALLETL